MGTGACLSPLGTTCGDSRCPNGFLCTPLDHVCVKSGCGNLIVEADEECDDGNDANGDGCDSNCTMTACGNGVVAADEACDDGNLDDADDCLSTCQLNTCGDGKVNPRAEMCDDSNLDDKDDCLSICQLNECGDGKVNPRAEACDDGNLTNDDGCNNDCTLSSPMYFKASNTGQWDFFGTSVALSADGSTLAVGARREASAATGIGGNQADNSAQGAGAVYVFTRSGSTWSQQAYVKASNTGAGDGFGSSVALSADGSTLAVGADWEASAATGIGSNQADNSAQGAGAVYVFTRSGSTWSQQAYVKASDTHAEDYFGHSVALSADGSTLAVGAYGHDVIIPNADYGAVFVFTRSGTAWSQQKMFWRHILNGKDYFGSSVALSADGSILAVGVPGAAAVDLFTRSGTTWNRQTYILASNTDENDNFGSSVALSADGSTLAVGAYWEDSAATGIGGNQADNSAGNSGAVYVFTRSGTTWSQQAYVKASNTGEDDYFGYRVALSADGSTLVVGAYGEASAATGIGGNQADNSAEASGAVYVFTRSGTTWSQQAYVAYVKASNTGAGDEFGTSVALSADGSTLAVGANGERSAATSIGGDQADNSAGASGAVYVYPRPAQQLLGTTAALSEPATPAFAEHVASVPDGRLGP
ncbi:MAG TPA: DUF4215 domain-containing protein [Kofleriaceae bacterium]|nr:DUF4215 domain-containing protein [Kofleriaceae bacterium]